MTKQEVIHILTKFNNWRRSEEETSETNTMPDPKAIWIAIDEAIIYLMNN